MSSHQNNTHSAMRHWIAILVAGNGISTIGDFVYLVALNLYVLDTTHSAIAVAAVWMVPLVAQMLIGAWVGSVTDRLPARTTLLIIEVLRAAIVFALPLVPILWIYPLLFVLGSASTFFSRTFLPYRTRLIPPAKRKLVNSLMSMTQSGALLLGPAIAGAFMAFGPVTYAFWTDAASFLVSGLSFLLLPAMNENTDSRGQVNATAPKNTWRALRNDWHEAGQFLRANWLFTTLIIASSVGVIFGRAADSQEVVYAENALHLGRFGYGMMVVAAGVGYLGGSLGLTVLAKYISTRYLIASGGVMTGAGYLVYALAHGFWQAVIGLIVLGVFGAAGGVGYNTYLQHAMPVERMGRINNLLDPPQQAVTLVLMLLASVITEQFGVRALMIGMTSVVIVSGVFTAVVSLQRRHRSAIDAETLLAPAN